MRPDITVDALSQALRLRRYFAVVLLTCLFVLTGLLGVPSAYAQDDNRFLAKLEIEGLELEGPFRHTVTHYTVEVPEDMDRLSITAEPQAATSYVDIIGNKDLQPGVNHITVRVTARDGSTLDYEIEAVRDGTVDAANAQLRSLVVVGHALTPAFHADTFEYLLDVDFAVSDLDIEAVAMDPNAQVHITGNRDFVVGVNEVVITVTSADDSAEQEYRIEVNRFDEVPADIALEVEVESDQDEQGILRYVLIAVGALALLASLATMAFLIVRKDKVGR